MLQIFSNVRCASPLQTRGHLSEDIKKFICLGQKFGADPPLFIQRRADCSSRAKSIQDLSSRRMPARLIRPPTSAPRTPAKEATQISMKQVKHLEAIRLSRADGLMPGQEWLTASPLGRLPAAAAGPSSVRPVACRLLTSAWYRSRPMQQALPEFFRRVSAPTVTGSAESRVPGRRSRGRRRAGAGTASGMSGRSPIEGCSRTESLEVAQCDGVSRPHLGAAVGVGRRPRYNDRPLVSASGARLPPASRPVR